MRALSSTEEGPESVLLVDGVNFLWCRGTRMQDPILLKKVAVDRLAIVHHLRRALAGDWKKGAIVTSINQRAAWPSDREKYTPGWVFVHLLSDKMRIHVMWFHSYFWPSSSSISHLQKFVPRWNSYTWAHSLKTTLLPTCLQWWPFQPWWSKALAWD